MTIPQEKILQHLSLDRLAQVLLAALLLVVVAWRYDEASFGYFHDDTLYFVSAQALATGQGYMIPSLPGEPVQTKYPVLYPLLLSVVWKVSSRFPINLALAVSVTALFGAALVAGWYALLRDLGATTREAAAVTAVAVLHPFLGSLAGAVLSDVPFMALVIWASVLTGRSLHGGVNWLWWGAVGCTVAAVLTRSTGIAVIAGLAVAMLRHRAWSRAAAVTGTCAAAFAASLWWSQIHQPPLEGLAGYRQNLLFYTSYWGFWKLSIPDAAALQALMAANFLEIVKAPGLLCFPLAHLPDNVYVQSVVTVALSIAILYGVSQLALHPIHLVLIFYSAVVLLWNYPVANRFLVPFVPVFWLGAWRLFRRAPRPLAAIALLAALDAGYTYFWVLPNQMSAGTSARRELAAEKGEAYRWISIHTEAGDRFISYEDVSLFLHTGRQAMRPAAFSSLVYYRDSASVLRRDLKMLPDTARQIRARFWLVAEDDYQLEEGADTIQRATTRLLQQFPVVFRSSSGRVRIYQISTQ